MIKHYVEHLTNIRKQALVIALMVPLAALGLASPALAKEPTGDFAVFKQCPRFTSGVNFCFYAQTKSGEVTLNKQNVPIKNTITLQGGIIRNEETEAETFVAALNGETLSKTPQPVPGGLLALVRCNEISNYFERVACELIFENGITGVNATTELARPASEIGINKNNLINQEGVALSLPVKVRLENPFLGNSCYIGSNTHPIIWNLTTGTTSPPAPNTPIKGKVGEIEFKDEFTFTRITGNSSVDNAYAAPEATGCGGIFSFLIDPIIDGKLGLPSPAGHNTTILNNTISEATGETVIASEK
jgi:hypothetical protein